MMIQIKKRTLQLLAWLTALALLGGLLAVLRGAGPARAAEEESVSPAAFQRQTEPAAEIQVDPELVAQLDETGSAGYLIYFREEADLSQAYGMAWEDRGRFVVGRLQDVAERSQKAVRAYLDENKVPHQSFWVDNVIAVETSARATFDGLLAFSEIASLRAEPVVPLIEPIPGLERPLSPQIVEDNLIQVGAPDVWNLGFRGEGLVVANIDTGARYSHEALAPQYRGNLGAGTFDHNYNWYDPYGLYLATPADGNGHGSHTMGTMIGDDGADNQIGMAPGADWIACRGCSGVGCAGTELLACAQFIVAPWDLTGGNPDPNRRPHVVNNSWGDCDQAYDPWYQGAVDSWHAAGIYPVFSNGNASNCEYAMPPGLNTVGNPARYGNVTGVGSTGNSNGIYANHSNWGPTDNLDTINPNGYPTIKPQVVAPGVNIRSSVATSDDDYGFSTGTSMSAPHVAGLVALMWDAAPCLVGDYAATETILQDTATPIPYATGNGDEGPGNVPNHATGWGEINALAAVQAARGSCGPFSLVVTPPVVQQVCTPDDALFEVEVTQNQDTFTETVTLSLQGAPVGATSSFSINPIDPPATSTLTLGTSGVITAGQYTLHVMGTAPTATLTSTVTLDVATAPPAAPALTSPADESTGMSWFPTFQWTASPGAESYLLEVASDAAFNNLVYTATVNTNTHAPTQPLDQNTEYHWRVTAANFCGLGGNTEAYSFTTAGAFCSSPGLDIISNQAISDTFSVPLSNTITDLNVYLDVSHTWVGDLSVSLVHSETGTTLDLVDRPGRMVSGFGCRQDDMLVIINDEGTQGTVEDTCDLGSPAISGDLVGGDPPDPSLLSGFDGEALDGNWVLTVVDHATGDSGMLNEWCLLPGSGATQRYLPLIRR